MTTKLLPIFVVFAAACAGCVATGTAGPTAEWAGWYSEYKLTGQNEPTEELLTIYPHGIALSGTTDPINSRINTDTGRHLSLKRTGAAYWFDEIPVFKPSDALKTIKNDNHLCNALKNANSYQIECKNLTNGTVTKSEYIEGFGFKWFDHYCGRDYRVCRYRFVKGSPVFGPKMIETINAGGSGLGTTELR